MVLDMLFVELAGHPFWVGTQAHPEFKSRPDRAHPLFRELVGSALALRSGHIAADASPADFDADAQPSVA